MFNLEGGKLFKKWSIRKISFVGILIAISVVFLVISVGIMPFFSYPSFKISFIGLPVKITGFIFGPIVGGLVGLLSDLISFLFLPTNYNPLYTLATASNGIIAGIIGWLFLKLFRYYFGGAFRDTVYETKIILLNKQLIKLKLTNPDSKKIKKILNKILNFGEKRKKIRIVGTRGTLLNFNVTIATLFLMLIIFLIIWLIYTQVSDLQITSGIIKNRFVLTMLMITGFGAMIIFLWFARFKMKARHFFIIVPIVVFSAFIELVNVPILSLADAFSNSTGTNSIFVYIFTHTILSPVKIWVNMIVIFFTYNIINPLINKNNGITY
ncbi:ECF transporter S component [Mycoplasma sp. 744]|uniref:ECF transporter S component n=1 Tax=Mycoplasma sp. 744 TaxID=3108531 RepID=UPI002B1E6B78|nr:ECF transporter S component [Mycoplasma sp. 744]MEA4115320.1 ECF transporter S component [Mycoplasma sp. 744]